MKQLVALVMIGVGLSLHAELEVSDVQVFSGKPWREVAIGYTITGTTSEPRCLQVLACDSTTRTVYDCKTLSGASVEPGRHIMKWNAQMDGVKICSSNVVIAVRVVEPLYCIVDLSDGASATNYPVAKVVSMPSGGWTDEHKTTKLVLRRIAAGTFTMGSDSQWDNPPHQVTLTKSFFIGVFEVTQRQYELVMGENPSRDIGIMRPVEQVNYNMIRGSLDAVGEDSFLGKLRARTGLAFELPTEAQWEYSCRAGTMSDYNNGGSTLADLKKVGRCNSNQYDGKGGSTSHHTTVGSYQPNAWGIYDMHGNVSEWCLDQYEAIGTAAVTDPKGAYSSNCSLLRGGSWYNDTNTSFIRSADYPWGRANNCEGFRLSWTLQTGRVSGSNDNDIFVLSEALSCAVAVDTTFEDECETINRLEVAYGSLGFGTCCVAVNEDPFFEASDSGIAYWWTAKEGLYKFVWQMTDCAMTTAVNVVELVGPFSPVVKPGSGAVFGSSLTVTMLCQMDGASIYYTLDGSEPTIESTPYKKFKVSDKTIVKAVAYRDGYYSDVVTCEYALGRCADPIVSPGDGMVFRHSGQLVRIDQNGEEGVLRYTIDGSEPTAESPVYEGPFTVDDSVVVKAKVFSDRYFDSAVVTVNLTREWETVATPVITAAEKFTGSEAKVVIASTTPSATIRYTTDGSEPTSGSPQYMGPFWVDESCIVKAVAMCEDYLTSEVASKTITKVWGIGDTLGVPDHAFATSGDAGFIRVEDASAPKGESMRSGEIGDSAGYDLYSRSVLSTTVHGPCTLMFKWRCSCEDDYDWDHAEFAVDGDVKGRICGVMDGWAEFTQVITEGGAHAVTWTYLKDSAEKDGADCLWVADYSWTPTELYTCESSVPVPYDWIRTYLPHTAYEYDHFEAAVREIAANGVNTVEEAYVAGLDPSDPKDKFVAKIEMIDGKSVVTWTPDLNEDGTKSARTYKTWGKGSLEADEWLEVTPENQDDMRFFKVTVDMP